MGQDERACSRVGASQLGFLVLFRCSTNINVHFKGYRMRHFAALGLCALLSSAAFSKAEASVWNVDPSTGQIFAQGSLTFTFVSRSAGFTHTFGLYDLSHALYGSPVFVIPPSVPGAVANRNVSGPFLFGLYVSQSGITWWSDGSNSIPDISQSIKFKFQNIDQYTTRLTIEDLQNMTGNSINNCFNTAWGIQEKCDYNDLVIDVTNTPEPATMGLLALGLVGISGAGYLKRKRGAATKA